jgi:formate hydrogenlyase subunit 3/multisubunit Na+/H+ antiporter MnhD subunit
MFISYDMYLSTLFTAKGLLLLSGKFLSLFYFRFIYIVLLVTVVSLLFCLNYNMSELFSFLVYIAIIFLSGLGLFYSDSIILFFIFYEFLLVPSFIILYKYSKTRRSVEAAFLMFF